MDPKFAISITDKMDVVHRQRLHQKTPESVNQKDTVRASQIIDASNGKKNFCTLTYPFIEQILE